MNVLGPFEAEIQQLVEIAVKRSGSVVHNDSSTIIMPVHELQIPCIVTMFSGVEVLHPDISLQALAQSSIR